MKLWANRPIKNGIGFLQEYFLGRFADHEPSFDEMRLPDNDSLCETGPDVVAKVASLIALRRPVLLTGSRGCGKTYCAQKGAALAKESGNIGGFRFLQGNRELPREYLSEDGLAIEGGKAVTVPALALTPISAAPGFSNLFGADKPPGYKEWLTSRKVSHDDVPWPAIPAELVEAAENGNRFAEDPRAKFWTPKDWWVLFLDEVNRFGDGFLDSLLSLAEEGKVVRRGKAYYVPVVLVCTANPPGYDITAKRLSPPLQSRIAASYRIGQPGIEVLNKVILEERLLKLKDTNAGVAEILLDGEAASPKNAKLQIIISDKLRVLASAYLICLWGDPGIVKRPTGRLTKGIHYLLPQTRWNLHELIATASADKKNKRPLWQVLDDLAALSEYGPDARAIGDWFALVIQKLIISHQKAHGKAVDLEAHHLRQECVSVLGKKIRETYNEASDPQKDREKENLLIEIFDIVFCGPQSGRILDLVYTNQVALLEHSRKINKEKEMAEHLKKTDLRWKNGYITAALDLISRSARPGDPSAGWELWRQAHSQPGALSTMLFEGCFRTLQARHWLARTIVLAVDDCNLAKKVMLLPCVCNVANLRSFALAAQNKDEKALAEITGFSMPSVGQSLDSAQMEELIDDIYQIYRSSALLRWQKHPERGLALAIGFHDMLRKLKPTAYSQAIQLEIDKAVHWYLGWYLEETVPGATSESDLIPVWSNPRPLKAVIHEAMAGADTVLKLLSLDASQEFQPTLDAIKTTLSKRSESLKRRRSAGGTAATSGTAGSTSAVRFADIILSGQEGAAAIDAERANARRAVFPFNLGGYNHEK